MRFPLVTLVASIMLWLVHAVPHQYHQRHGHEDDSDIVSIASHANSSSAIVPGKYFDRVVIIVFENKDYRTAMKDKYLKSLPSRHNGVLLTNYHGTSHPSQPNYIAMVSGSTDGTNEDDESNFDRESIVDLLEKKQISWKSYQEDYPGHCSKEMDVNGYARKHNPFVSFKNIQKDKNRCGNIVNADELDKNIAADTVPQYIFYTPNIKNDAHDTSMGYGSKWLKRFLEPRISKSAFSKNTMFVVTFDEDDSNTKSNHVYTALFGPDFKRSSNGRKDHKKYTHYSLLRTIENNWDLGDLGKNDKDAVGFDL